MTDLDNLNSSTYCNQANSQCHGENVNIIIVTRKRLKNHKNHNVFIQAQQYRVPSRLSRFSRSKKQVSITRHSSMPELNECTWPTPPRNRSGPSKVTIKNKYKLSPLRSNVTANFASEHRFDKSLYPFNYRRQIKLIIYRCEFGGTVDNNCCCTCNSDAMFEIMRGLYECYKKRDCTNCTCILCSHIKPEDKLKFSEREKVLREQAMKGFPLPEGKTLSEKKLINKVRADLGVPIEPKTKEIRDKHEEASKAGKLLPLEGKTPEEKEKILQDLFEMGIPLPKGRTPSEKALIAKISGKPPSEMVSLAVAHSEQIRRAQADGLLTPLKDKSPEYKENVLKRLAMIGLPLPEGQSPSENKLIDKVRTDLGLPIEPETKDIRDKHEKASKAGKLIPLEGKTPKKKEKILEGLHDMGIPLPIGRTPTEKSLIAKIAASPRSPSQAASATLSPSKQMHRAQEDGLITPLKGKSPEYRENILKRLAMKGLPLPEAQSQSEKKLIKKVRRDLGVPIEPKTKTIRQKHEEAAKAGKLLPLEGKKTAKKKKILEDLHNMGIPLPAGRTSSEKALIAEIKSKKPIKVVSAAPSELMRRAKEEELRTPLSGKTPEQKEKIVKTLAMKGLPLPEDQSPSEKKLIDKVRTNLGLPKYPTTKSMKERHDQAAKAGLLQPLEGKTPAEKEKVLKGLRNLGIPLPEGRTPSEKDLITKIKVSPLSIIAPSEQLRSAKIKGLLTPLKDKSPEQKENIVKGLAIRGLPLPEAESPSEKKLIDKVRTNLGLPKDPTTKSMKDRHDQAAKAGLLQPLEGKTPAEKEKILKGLRNLGIPLPEGRTTSEKALVEKIKTSPPIIAPSEQLHTAKVEGLLTPLKGKSPEQKENIVKGLAMKGLPLPEATSPSEKKLINKVRADLGLPKDPITKSMKDTYDQAAKTGLLLPLEGKTPAEKEKVLKGLWDLGIPLPEGRTPSEKDLIEKVKASPRSIIAPSEQMRRAKAEGLLTQLKGKPAEQKVKILKGLAMKGLALPEGQSRSEKKLIKKIRAELGLPKDPTSKSMKDRHDQAAKAGLLLPLEGKTPAEKEKVLKGLRDLGIPLPKGRTPSEKDLIDKVKALPRSIIVPSEMLRKAKAEGLLTPLKGKPPQQKEKILKGLAMKGLALPEGQSPSERKLIDKVRADLGLPKVPSTKSLKVKHEQAAKAGLLQPLEGKTPAEKEKVLKGLRDLGIPLPEGRTPSEKALIRKVKESVRSVIAPSEQLRIAKAEGLLTPVKGKTPEQKEKILKGLAMKGLALPEGQSPSERKLIDKVRADLGLPKEPSTKSLKVKHEQAAKAGLLQPLEGKTPAEKEKVLKGLRDLGIPLPEGRTPSEKALIGKVKETPRSVVAPSEQLRIAKAEGLLTPVKGKTLEQKEKILKGLAMKGLALPESQSPSEKKIIARIRAGLGLPKEPSTKSMKVKHEQAAKVGLLQPLEGKTPAEKEKVSKGLRDLGIPLPEGRTPSEKALIGKVKETPRSVIAPSEQLRIAKAEGLLTPVKGKTPEQKEKILKGLAMKGLALPESQSPSEKKIIEKIRADLGLPKEPSTKSMKVKHEQAAKVGLLQPLEGKTPAEKEKVLKGLRDLGIPLPKGRTPSEKALIGKVKETPRSVIAPSEQLRIAKAEGLLTPVKGKTPEQKEKILKGLAMKGLALPEGQSPSEKKLIEKVRADLGLPKDPSTKSLKVKHEQAAKAGLLQPLEGKTPAEKKKVLKGLRDFGIPLPAGRTPSEKDLIEKVKASSLSIIALSKQRRKAKAEGLLTPLKDKPLEQKEKILKGLAMKGLALPEGQSPSEKKLIDKVRGNLGLPKEPTTKSMKDKHDQAAKAGLLLPLEGKTPAEKKKVLKVLQDLGIPLPEGRTPSEKDLIEKVKASSLSIIALSKQLRKAKAEGLLTPLKGKPLEQKEKILKGLAMKGLALPEGQSPSEKKLIDKVRGDLGLPKEPSKKSLKVKHEQAAKAGLLRPLEGKTRAEKEKILKGLHDLGIPLPEGRTPSEKDVIEKVKVSSRSIIAPSEQMRRAKLEGLFTPLKGKTPEQNEKNLKGIAMKGLALPEGQSTSEKKLIEKVRADLGLPKDPSTKSLKVKHEQAAEAGLLQPLEGKTPAEKKKVLKGLRDLGIPLPEGRTPSEKALIGKVKESPRSVIALSKQLRKAKLEGVLTPLKSKTPEQKEKILKRLAMKGLALPEGKSPSEKKIIDKVRADIGLPKEPSTKSLKVKHEQAAKAGLLQPLEGKTPAEKEKVLKGLRDLGIPLPEGRTPSEKALIRKVKESVRSVIAPSEQLRIAKAEGLLTPVKGKTPKQKEKILKGLAMKGLALPEGQSPSERKLIDKVRADLGLPKEPSTKSLKVKHEQAAKAGLLQPLEGKTPAEKEKVLKGLRDLGIPLPEGRTPSEKALIRKVKETPRSVVAPSEQLRIAKAEGLLTPVKGKTLEQKEKILKGLAMKGLALPESQSPSEKKIIARIRAGLGLPKEPSTKSMKVKHEQAAKVGLLQPLEGKTPAEKEKVLKGLRDLGIPLPEGRTPSEKALIGKVKETPRSVIAPSEQLRIAKAEGLLTPVKGKTPEQKEKILKGLAMKGLALPESQSPSEKKIIEKIRADLGLPKEPSTKSMKVKHEQAAKVGLLQPLEGKTPAEKEKVLKGLRDLGIPLPKGRTPSEKALIGKVKETPRSVIAPSEQLRIAKAEGLLTPVKGKTPEQKEKILKGLAMKGLALPESQSPSEKKIIEKIRTDLGLPKEPSTKSMKVKHEQAAKVGLLQPLEGKTPAVKEKVLKGLRDLGIPLPEGRTPSEKALIGKVKETPRSVIAPSEQLRRAKVEGLLTPLKGKTPEQKEKILKGLAMKGLALPEGQSPSEKKLIEKVRADLGLPKDPSTKSLKVKHEQAAKAGLLQPLEGKTPAEKKKVLKGLRDFGIPLPAGRTPSEKALIGKFKVSSRSVIAHSKQLRRAKAKGLRTPLKGKTPEDREKILKRLAMRGLLLPKGQSPSESKLIDKVRTDLGLPIEPKTKEIRNRHKKASKFGRLLPLEGKTPAQKKKILTRLHNMIIPLPVGRTPSEKSLIAKIAASPRSTCPCWPTTASSGAPAPSEQMRRAKAEGLLTPLKGKTLAQKEKLVKGLAMRGLPLPEAESPSEKKLIDKVRADLGLPKDPTTKSMKDRHDQAAKAGLLQPLEGKTPAEKEKVLKGFRNLGIPLPEGRTPSEKDLIEKVKASSRSVIAPSEQLRRAKAEGLLTSLKGKPPEQKENILKGLAMKGLALPEGESPSEKKLIDKVRADLGLPKEPSTKSMKVKHEQAAKAGLLQPLEGKTPAEKENVLKGLRGLGIPFPEGRTPSEKDLMEKVKASPRSIIAPSEQLLRAKAEGLLTPLNGKPPEQKEKILKKLAMKGLDLPEGQSPSEKKLIDKVRANLGLPKEPSTKSLKVKHEKAAKAGLLQPLEGKTPTEKEKVLKGLRDFGIPLPAGRTPSEKALIEKVKESVRSVIAPFKELGRAKAEGLLTPLKGKTLEDREKFLKGLAMRGLPLPEGQSPSENKVIEKVRTDLGLPIEPKTKRIRDKHEKASKFGRLLPLESKTPEEKEKILSRLHNMRIPLPVGRTPSEKSLIAKITACPQSTCPCWSTKASSVALAPSEQMRRAKAEGLLTPLKGKTLEQKEKIVKGLAMRGLPLPEAESPSEKKLIDKVRADLGLPKDPTTKSMKDRHDQAAKAGLLQPLEGKTPAEKEKVLKGLRDLGIPLPEGRTPSEKDLIEKVKASSRSVIAPSEQLRRAKAEGLLTPLKGKPPEQKEKILKGLAMKGLTLPEAQSPSEKKLIDKVRADLGLPKDPTTKSMKEKHEEAAKAGLLQPLEGKTNTEKAKILKGLRDLGIPLPEGRTPSEKALINKVKASPRSIIAPSEQLRRAKAEGLLTPLKGKPPEQKEKILKGLAMKGLALPEAQSPSEKKLIDKVRADLGLPKDPKSKSMKEKHEQAAKAGLLQPLEGKTNTEKAKILKGLRDLGIPLPEGRTPSEKALINKVKASSRTIFVPSEQLRRAEAEGLLTPLEGKSPEQKEKILKGLAMKGLALPEAQSPSEKKLIDKVRFDLGLPKDPKSKSMKEKHEQAAKAGLLQPLEGKTPAEKEKILKGLRDLGIRLPEGRSPSEKALINKVNASPRSVIAPSEQLRRAQAEGLLTPLEGKPQEQKEKILKGLAMKGLALPEAQSPSEKKLIDKVRADLGLPKDPKSKSMKKKHEQAAKAGLLQPLHGKTNTEKAKILKGLRDLGIPLPEGRSPSEKALINKVKASSRTVIAHSEQLRIAKAEGLLTPLEGKPPEQKEKILKGLAMRGLVLPKAQSPSEKKLIDKVRTDLGLPKDPTTKSMKEKHEQAAKAGLLQPLEGKTPAEKLKVLKGLRDLGIPLPEGRTPSEKALIAKVKASSRSVIALSERLLKAKEEGLLTSLKGKTPQEREKILRGLAMKGLPLPEGKSLSENELTDKVRTDLGLPIEPTTKDIKDKHDKAAKAGKLLPLEGKTPAQKEKILKDLHNMGIPLPIGRTPSEKSLIAKIAASPRSPSKMVSVTLSPAQLLRAAKAEGLLTPLKNKTLEERENILKGLAMKGLPLPEGQSPSENKLIDKVRADLGLPIEPKTKNMRDKHEQAFKAGKLLPLEGKTLEKKEKILKDLHDMGIPLPIGRTASEKALIAKVMAGPATGVAEEYEEIEKTTKCDRACGCDRKKIRFKHSYIKIKVTSPDISSFCDCPDECLPRVKSGVIIDNEGISVTVASALGIPSFTANYNNYNTTLDEFSSQKDYIRTHTEHIGPKKLIGPKDKIPSFESSLGSSKVSYVLSNSSYFESNSTRPKSTESENIYLQSSTLPLTSKLERTVKSNLNPTSKIISTASSLSSILVLKSEMSLCSTISNNTMNTVSLTSVMNSSITSTSTHYSSYQPKDDPQSSSSLEELSASDDLIDRPATIGERKNLWNIGGAIPKSEFTILRVNQTILDFVNSEVRTNVLNYKEDPVGLMNDLQTKVDVTKIMNKIMSKKRFADASSIFIVVPMSEDEEEPVSSNCIDSMTSIYSCETEVILKDTSEVDLNLTLRPPSYAKRSEQICRKGTNFYMKEISSSDTETMFQNESVQALQPIEMMKDEFCQISRPDEIAEKAAHAIGTDTTTSIPCCCCPKEYSNPFVSQNCSPNQLYTANVISRQKKSLSLQGKTSGRCHLPDMRTPKPFLQSLDLHATCEVLAQTSSGFCPIAHKATSCSHVPDMRTPSSMSVMQPCDKPGAVGSRLLPRSAKSGGCCLPDMRTPPSLVQLRDSSSALKSRMLPNKTTSYCRLPDMSSAASLILQSEVLSSSSVDLPSLSQRDETCGCCCSPASTKAAKLLSDIPTCSDSHVSLDNSLRVPARLGHDMHYSRIETTSPQINRREFSSHTIKKLSDSSNKRKTTFKTYPDEVTYPIAFENPTHTDSIQRRASQQSYMSIYYPDEEDFLCEDIEGTDIIPYETLIRKLRIQESCKSKLPIDPTDVDDYMDYGSGIISEPQNEVSRKSEMPTDFAEEVCWHFYCGCENTESTDNMSYPKLRLLTSGNSKMPKDPTNGEHRLCEDIEDTNKTSTQRPLFQRNRKTKMLKHYVLKDDFENKDEKCLDINTIKMGIQLQPLQTNWKSKIPIDSIDEEDCLCEDILVKGTDNIPSQKPQLQASSKSKIPINPANENHCLCENIEAPNIITDKISNNRPRPQVNRKPKVSNYSTDKDDCLCKEIKGTDKMPNQEPQIQVTGKFKMPINPSDGNHCPCEEKEGTSERSIQQTRFQAKNKKYKMLKDSTIKEDFKNKGKEPAGITPDELGNEHPPPHVNWKSIKLKNSTVKRDYKIQQKPKNLTIKDCECQQQSKYSVTKVNCECLRQSKDFAMKAKCECQQYSKDSVTKVNCECLRQSKDFAIKANCECQQYSKDSVTKVNCECLRQSKDFAIKANCECQQHSKVSTSNVFCACEEKAARNRLYITNQGQQQDRATTNSSKITKLMTRIRKSISHKIHTTGKDKFKENLKDEKKCIKPQSKHNIQTTPGQVLHSQHISPNVPSEPEVVNDGYPHEYSSGWIDYTSLIRLKSELTETTSGFKVCKKRTKRVRTKGSIFGKPNAEIELDFEDAIKYYVGKNLDQFRDLISPIESLQKTAQGANKKAKEYRKDGSEGSDTNIDNFFGSCECLYRPVPLKISYKPITLTPEDSAELAKRYPKGFKFCLGGTGLQPAHRPDAARKPDRTSV